MEGLENQISGQNSKVHNHRHKNVNSNQGKIHFFVIETYFEELMPEMSTLLQFMQEFISRA